MRTKKYFVGIFCPHNVWFLWPNTYTLTHLDHVKQMFKLRGETHDWAHGF